MRMTNTPKSNKKAIVILAAKVCLMAFFSINLFGQDSASQRVGVCNAATELKPIEVESDSQDRSIAYPNLSEAFYAINQGVHTGEVDVEVCFDSIEREAAILNSQETESADYSKVTIRPLKDNLTISAKTGYNALIALKGTDYVTIDGDNPNSAGINRNLTIKGWGGRSVIAVQTRFHSRKEYDGASHNTIKNLNIFANATPSYGIALGGHNPGSSGRFNHYNSVVNCAFRRVRMGIFSGGTSPGTPNIGTIIRKNDLSTVGGDRVRLVGIHLEYETEAMVTDNRIGGLRSHARETQDQIGIRLGGGRISSLAKSCAERCYRSVSNSLVARNVINGVGGRDRQSVAGIYIYGNKNFPNIVRNNVVTGVIGSGRTPNILAGIFVAGQNKSKTLVYNNSVSMTGERGSDEIHNPSFAFVLWGKEISALVFNNIFANTQTAEKNPWAKSFAAGIVTSRAKSEEPPLSLIESNNNIFYSNGENVGFVRLDSIQRREGSEIESLSDWQNLSGQDADSLAKNPLFVNPSNDLNIQPKSPAIDSGIDADAIIGKMSIVEKLFRVAEVSPNKNNSVSNSNKNIGAH